MRELAHAPALQVNGARNADETSAAESLWPATAGRWGSRAGRARDGTVRGDARSSGVSVCGGEACSNVELAPCIRLVWRSATELDVGNDRVVLMDVLGDETAECADGIERVQVEPLVPEYSPERFYHRVGEMDPDLRDDMFGHRGEVGVGADDHVLRSAVSHDANSEAGRDALPRHRENGTRRGRAELGLDSPGKHLAGVVVGDCVHVRARAVEQANDRNIDMPPLARCTRADSDLRCWGDRRAGVVAPSRSAG
ncbi:Hypothetical protein I5071_57620 [Sandaracinus amylolyticus]|nr:Hypothetical protein I5071_57620 [Sandaracinus amylolyticus]